MQLNGKFLIEKENSGLGLSGIIKFCGFNDPRIIIGKGKVIQGGKSHSAIGDARIEAECFSRLVFGKGFFQEYSKFSLPIELRK